MADLGGEGSRALQGRTGVQFEAVRSLWALLCLRSVPDPAEPGGGSAPWCGAFSVLTEPWQAAVGAAAAASRAALGKAVSPPSSLLWF